VKRGATQPRRIALTVATIAAAMLVVVTQGVAQSERKSPGLFKAQPQQRDQPVRIASASLEVRDKSKMATFSGNVHIVQGEFDVRSNTLVVFYDDEKDISGSKKTADAGRSNQQIRRMEARGSVVITQKDQRAIGDRADFDMRTNTVTLIGNVVVTRCEDVLRGRRLFVDMTTGVSRMEGGVEGVLNSQSRDGAC
jgi:lipopolysaccharide export system protein LptA